MNISKFDVNIFISYIFNSDCSSLEEELSNYENGTSGLSACNSPDMHNSGNELVSDDTYHQELNAIASEQCTNITFNDETTDSEPRACGSNIGTLSEHPPNNKKRKFGIMDESVRTFPADSSYEDHKETKYKAKREKNNMAAKKSRDARKIRENQLKVKVLCLENANDVLRAQVYREQADNQKQRKKIDELEQRIKELEQMNEYKNGSLKLGNTLLDF